jgi:hypothetical protein
MNNHEYNNELKRIDLREILIHLIHICVHVEQSKHLFFLGWLVRCGGTNSYSRPFKNLKVTTRNVFIPMAPQSKCVDIVMLCKVHTAEVYDLFQFKFFCDATFNLSLIANHCSKLLQGPFNVMHPSITTRNPFIYDILVMMSPFFVMEQGSLMTKLYISSWMIGLAVNPLVHL